MPAASYNDYARCMLALPGTSDEIAARCGMTSRGVTIMFRRLWALKLLHPGELRHEGHKQHPIAVWHAGEGPRADGLRLGGPMQPRANHVAFATMWRALQDGAKAHELAEQTGVSHVSVYRLLEALRGAVRVCAWEGDALGRPVAVWELGTAPGIRKPQAASPSRKSRRYRERLVHRALQFKAVPVRQMGAVAA